MLPLLRFEKAFTCCCGVLTRPSGMAVAVATGMGVLEPVGMALPAESMVKDPFDCK